MIARRTLKLKVFWTSYFKKTISVINKSTTVPCNNAAIIDHINTNHFLNNSMHCGILDHFPIFLTSKDFMLDFINDPIHIAKREIYNKSTAYFKTLLSIVDWKHVLNENSPNNAYNEFWKILGDLYNEAFPKQNIKISRNWIINNTKHFPNLWKRNQRKTVIQILSIQTNIIIKKRGMLWKKLLETK